MLGVQLGVQQRPQLMSCIRGEWTGSREEKGQGCRAPGTSKGAGSREVFSPLCAAVAYGMRVEPGLGGDFHPCQGKAGSSGRGAGEERVRWGSCRTGTGSRLRTERGVARGVCSWGTAHQEFLISFLSEARGGSGSSCQPSAVFSGPGLPPSRQSRVGIDPCPAWVCLQF